MEYPVLVNIFEWQGTRDAMRTFRKEISDAAWKELRSTVSRILLDGKPVYAGLIASSGAVGQRRFAAWLSDSVTAVIQQVNQIVEFTKPLGGPIPLQQSIFDEVATIVDRYLCDLILLSAKLNRPSVFPVGVASGVPDVLRLAEVLPNMDWDSRFDNQLRNHLDECAYLLLVHFLSGKRVWIVVLRPHRLEYTDTDEFSGSVQPSHEINLDAARLDGEVLQFQFASASTPDDLSEKLRCHIDFSEYGFGHVPPALEDSISRLRSAREGEAKCDFLCFVIDAHILTIQQRVGDLLRYLSGIVALFRNPDEVTRVCRIATIRTQEKELRFSTGDPSRVEGIAISGPAARMVDPIVIRNSNAKPETIERELHFGAAILPVDQEELSAIARQVAITPTVDLVFRMIVFGGQLKAGIGQLQRAFHFWARGELQRQSVAGEHYSVWCISDAFLAYCTVAEILAGAKDNVTELMASRLSAVLSEAPDARAEIYRQVKTLYGKRSRYVHDGEAIIRYEDLLAVREIVRKSLMYAVRWLADEWLRRSVEANSGVSDVDVSFKDKLWSIIQPSEIETFQKHCDSVRFGMPRVGGELPKEEESSDDDHSSSPV